MASRDRGMEWFLGICSALAAFLAGYGGSMRVDEGTGLGWFIASGWVLGVGFLVGFWYYLLHPAIVKLEERRDRIFAARTKRVPKAGSSNLKILKATYGTDARKVSVVDRVVARVRPEGRLDMSVSNQELGGDPVVGERKTLAITYREGGRRRSKEFHEGSRAVLP